MAVIRRNPRLSAVLGSVCLVLIVGLVLWTRTAAHAQGTYLPLDAATLSEIDQLREDAGLSDDALIYLNVPADRLETLLAAVRSWHMQNGAQWLADRNAVRDQQARIRGLETEAGLGRDQRRALDDARAQLVQLQAAYDTRLSTLRTTLLTGLSDDQQHLFDRVRTRVNVPMPYRALDLTAEQDRTLNEAIASYHQRLATASSEERTALESEFDQRVATIIGANNVRTLDLLGNVLPDASARLVSTLHLVFPLPPEG